MGSSSSVTEPRILFDSNCCIYIIEGISQQLRRRTENHAPGVIITSAVAYAEVAIGVDRTDPQRVRNFERLFDIIPVLPFNQLAADRYALLPFSRHRYDRLIAAHALALGLTLVTANVSDFAGIANLRVEDWTR